MVRLQLRILQLDFLQTFNLFVEVISLMNQNFFFEFCVFVGKCLSQSFLLTFSANRLASFKLYFILNGLSEKNSL